MNNPFKQIPPARVVHPLQADHKAAALRELTAKIEDAPEVVDYRGLLSSLFQRESTHGNGAGEGLVLLHTTDINVRQPILLLGVSPGGIRWDEDGAPVHLVFIGVWPPGQEPLRCETVAEVARILHDKGCAEGLAKCSSSSIVLDLLCGRGRLEHAAA